MERCGESFDAILRSHSFAARNDVGSEVEHNKENENIEYNDCQPLTQKTTQKQRQSDQPNEGSSLDTRVS